MTTGLLIALLAQFTPPSSSPVSLADGGVIGGCIVGSTSIECPVGFFGVVDAGTVLATTAVKSPLVQTDMLDAGQVQARAVDAGMLTIGPGAEIGIGLAPTASAVRCITLNKVAGLSVNGGTDVYMCFNSSSNVTTFNAISDFTVQSGSGNTLTLSAGAAGAIAITGSKSVGACTLNGGSPSTCTATVRSGSRCNCSTVATGAVSPGLSGTTLTCTGPNGSTADTNYFCF